MPSYGIIVLVTALVNYDSLGFHVLPEASMAVVIRKCAITELEAAPNFGDLLEEYAGELVVDGAPKFSAKMEMYYTLEKTGSVQAIGAYCDDVLVGFVTVLLSVFPHCGVLMACTESLFVAKEYRKTGAGLKLIRTAENYVRQKGSPCLFVSAPFGGNLAEVLPHIGYVETNRVFFRNLANG